MCVVKHGMSNAKCQMPNASVNSHDDTVFSRPNSPHTPSTHELIACFLLCYARMPLSILAYPQLLSFLQALGSGLPSVESSINELLLRRRQLVGSIKGFNDSAAATIGLTKEILSGPLTTIDTAPRVRRVMTVAKEKHCTMHSSFIVGSSMLL